MPPIDPGRRTRFFVAAGIVVLLFAFTMLAVAVSDGRTQAFDSAILLALRNSSDLSVPIGPAWMTGALFDVTALGSATVLGLVVFAVTGCLLLQRRAGAALTIALTWFSGEWLNAGMKQGFDRPRPSIVPPLRAVFSASFPSGHAMASAIVYLTIAAVLIRLSASTVTRVYILAVALLLTLLVGISRVYLGLHYPTDVLGGWILGCMWASTCWLLARRLERL